MGDIIGWKWSGGGEQSPLQQHYFLPIWATLFEIRVISLLRPLMRWDCKRDRPFDQVYKYPAHLPPPCSSFFNLALSSNREFNFFLQPCTSHPTVSSSTPRSLIVIIVKLSYLVVLFWMPFKLTPATLISSYCHQPFISSWFVLNFIQNRSIHVDPT